LRNASRTRSRASFASACPYSFPHEFAAVLMAEVQRDGAGIKLQHVPRVPAEVWTYLADPGPNGRKMPPARIELAHAV
jgi:hypothetical protein